MRSLRSFPAFLRSRLTAWGRPRLEAVEHVDLPRYMGSWRVIAIYDNPVERNFADAVESYRHLGEGRIAVEFRWREKDLNAPLKLHRFAATVVDRQTNASWRVRLFPLFYVRYVIIALDEKYRWVAIGHPSRKFGWILARKPAIPDDIRRELLEVFRQQGYDPARFVSVPQPAAMSPSPSSISAPP